MYKKTCSNQQHCVTQKHDYFETLDPNMAKQSQKETYSLNSIFTTQFLKISMVSGINRLTPNFQQTKNFHKMIGDQVIHHV